MSEANGIANGQTSDRLAPTDSQPKRFFSPLRVCIIFLIFFAIGFALFHKGYRSNMVYDSAAWIVGKEQVYATHDLVQIISIVPARALFMLGLYANYALTGMDPYYFRLVNTAILAGAGVALAWLILILMEIPLARAPGSPREKWMIALFLGLAFVAHPLQSYVVLYDWQREAVMACLFYFLTLAVYLGVRAGRFRNEGLGYVLTAVLFFAGLQSKENVATAPIMMFLAEIILFRQSFKQLLTRCLMIALLVIPALAAYVLMANTFFGPESVVSEGMIERLQGQYSYGGVSPLQVLLTEPRVFFSYLLMMVAPVPQFLEFIRAQPISSSLLGTPITLLALGGLFGLIAVGIALVRRYPLVSFGIFFCTISVMPESLMIPNYLFFGYRAILPMAGIMMIVAYALALVFAWAGKAEQTRIFKPALSTALVFTLVCLAALSFGQAMKWSPLQFWKTPADRLPPYSENLERVAYLDIAVNCSLELINSGKFAEAIDLYGKACSIPPESEKAMSKFTEEPDRGSAYKSATEKLLKNFADKPDRSSGVLMNLGVVLAATGNLPEAINQYRKAIEIWPYSAILYVNLGASLESSNNPLEAMQEYEKGILVDPKCVAAYNCLAAALKKYGYIEQALDLYRRAIEADPGTAAGYKNFGVALEEAGGYQEAANSYKKVTELEPKSAEAHLNLGRALTAAGNPQEAAAVLKKAVELDPGLEAARTQLGFALQQSGNVTEAIQEYRKAVEINPNSFVAYNNLGMALKQVNNLREAAAAFHRAIEIYPEVAVAHNNLGSTLEQLGRLGQAMDHYRTAVEINPDMPDALHNLGLALRKSGDLAGAVEQLSKALDIDPNLADVQRDLGRTFEEAGELDNALECYRKAAQLDPDSAESNLDLAKCLAKTGKHREAIESYKKVVELRPTSVETLAEISVALLRSGSIPDAIATLGKGLALNKENADLFNALGLAFIEMKKMPEAAQQFKKALALDPDHSEAKSNLERFEKNYDSKEIN